MSTRRRSVSGMLTDYSLKRPKVVLYTVLIATIVSAAGFIRLQVDTDPENMLPADDPVRVRNAMISDELGAGPMIVVGLFGDVQSPATLNAVADVHRQLTARSDVVAEATVSIASVFDHPISSADGVTAVVDRVSANPMLAGNVLFADRPGTALFIALTGKGAATDVADAATAMVEAEPALAGFDVSVGGQPLAEDAFGQEMFIQMAIFAPLAGLLVFVILLIFFRRLRLVAPAMVVALATVIMTMGALTGTGNTLHIMSSMIPIFLMPVAILDSVHVLSEFFDRNDGRDRTGTIAAVMVGLARPMGYTTLTTMVGFAALLLVPIPPVRVFGLFVALGVGLAWLLTVTFLPAYLSIGPAGGSAPATVASFGSGRLGALGHTVVARRRAVIAAVIISGLAAVPALTTITVNDNPVRWFGAEHEVRVASARLGDALPGTFSASLLASAGQPEIFDRPQTRVGLASLADHLRSLPEVGAVQTYLDGDHPVLRNGALVNIRMQLRTGDNTAMQGVVDSTERYLADHPIEGLELDWAGEAYLNLRWQNQMVNGMLLGFATTLAAILILLVTLFRSIRWAVLAMIPVVWTVLIVYGGLAVLGRDFDMPIAVLSTMVLGIGVDFAIHFVERYRGLLGELGSRRAAVAVFYREPARALTRNAAVIAIGFSPLVFSALVPYVVVGLLLASIVGLSWLATIIVLPALVAGRPDRQWPARRDPRGRRGRRGRPHRVRRLPVTAPTGPAMTGVEAVGPEPMWSRCRPGTPAPTPNASRPGAPASANR